MAQSARKSLAGSAAAAAKKMIGRRPKAEPEAKAPAKKSSAAKAPAKKAPAAKTSAKKSSTAKAPAKKAPAKKAPAKKAPAKKAPATKSSAAKAPAKKGPAKKAPAAKAPAKQAPAKQTPAAKTPAKKASAAGAPAKQSSAEAAPVQKTSPTTQKTSTKKAGPVKKAPVKSASVGSLKVKEGEDAWTSKELDEVLADLHDHRERLVAIMEAQEAELTGLMKDAGDGAGQDQADLGATSFERDHELTLMNSEREMVEQIDKALARIDDGTYGVCESCGEPIGKMRVMAFPRATLCLTCKQREERR